MPAALLPTIRTARIVALAAPLALVIALVALPGGQRRASQPPTSS